MSLTDLRATNICEFTTIEVGKNWDNGVRFGVRFEKPNLIDKPSIWKRETDRPAWAAEVAYRRTQKMLIQRDLLSGGLAIDAPDMKKAKTQLKELARLAERGVSPEQISWKVGFEKNFATKSSTERGEAIRHRMDLTRMAQANLMVLITELLDEDKYTGHTKDICELFKKGLADTLREQAPFVSGAPQRKRADVTSAVPTGQLALMGQPQPASTGRPQPQQAPAEDPQVTAQKLLKKKMLGDAAVTVAAYQRDPRSIPVADYNLAKALLEQDKADRELAEFMKKQEASATASTTGSRPTQTTTTAATGATRTTTTTATTATTTTTTVPTNAHRRDPSTANANPSRAQDNKSYQPTVRDLDDDQV
ncbi:hypothetical protein [Hydrogenophaga sp. BPS33]|uniref:hypothetical protein n=1 Tax=Hydrogenophaga sp. BPS33 TaxID=2651974 RepID=UPI00132013A0|nr:hypothetical protein [Hydrogenophaga sp. BPS33]QHE83933.1 hypothetical protein F9K07_03055 [Hydrogenophaga sp. BPS33]